MQYRPLYEEHGSRLMKDPWKARDQYVSIILDRSPQNRARFLAEHAIGKLSLDDEVRLWKMLELMRHAMLMYTSCGWFFDDLSGIETVQVIQYAGRVVQLGEELFDASLEEGFLQRLARAHSNLAEQGDGAAIYRRSVKPNMVDLAKLGAHYAISSLFESYPKKPRSTATSSIATITALSKPAS
jgi:alpha-amylase/alpha-mannosidase (GH57 family)